MPEVQQSVEEIARAIADCRLGRDYLVPIIAAALQAERERSSAEIARLDVDLKYKSSIPWRVGKKIPLNVYAGDRPVCQCHSPNDAKLIVAAVNKMRRESEGRI